MRILSAALVAFSALLWTTCSPPDPVAGRTVQAGDVGAGPAVSIFKSGSPDPVAVGSVLTYTIDINVAGSQSALGVLVTDTLPASACCVTATPLPGTCLPPASGVLSCDLGDLPPGLFAGEVEISLCPQMAGTVKNVASVTASNDSTSLDNTSPVSTTVTRLGGSKSDLSITKTDSPDPVGVNGTLTYTLLVQNHGPDEATNVTVTDTKDPATLFRGATPTQGTCGTPAGDTLTCTLGTLPAGGNATVTVEVAAPGAATTVTNSASVASDSTDSTGANNMAVATTTVATGADLEVAKFDLVDPVAGGSQLTYVVEVTNKGPETATEVSLTDTLFGGLLLIAVQPSLSCLETPPTVTCSLGNLASGERTRLKIIALTPMVPPGMFVTVGNQASVATTATDPVLGNNTASQSTQVTFAITPVDLLLTKSAPSTAAPGQSLTYELTVTNKSTTVATGVTLTDLLPNATFVSASVSQGICQQAGTLVSCALGTLMPDTIPGAIVTGSIVVIPNASSPIIINVAEVHATEPEPTVDDLNPNTATVQTIIQSRSTDVSLRKSADKATVSVGETLTYSLVVSNIGLDSAPEVVVTDQLPPNVTFQSASVVSGGSGTCNELAGTVTCNLGTVPIAGGSQLPVTVQIQVAPTAAASGTTIVNTATVTTSGTDTDTTNNTAAACTEVLAATGQVIVIKQVVNDNGGTATASNFQMTVTGSNPSPASFPGALSPGTTVTLNAGAYSVSETSLTGYSASLSADCTGTIAAGQTKTCTITNDDQAPSLTLVKQIITDNGGTAVAADWTLTATGPTTISGAGGATSGASFDAGTYTLSETGPAGYTASAWTCVGGAQNGSQITLGLGQSATCTITNDDIAPTLTVTKLVVNDNGGTETVSDFLLFVDSAPVDSGVQNTFSAGSHTVSETSVNGYTATFGVDCDATGQVTLALGDVKTCTITNNDNLPSLTLIKQIITDNGGTATAASFTLTATGPTSISGAGGATSGASFDAGTYTLSETGPAGYTASAWSCMGGLQTGDDITIGLGESATCTIINDDNAPSLTLVKQVINDNGGTAVAANWMLTATGPTSISGAGGATSGASFDAGTYALSESTGPAGYTASGWSCVGGTQSGSNITVGLGQSATCTIVNDDIAPKLTVTKLVVNDNGGTETVSDFFLFVDSAPVDSGVQNTFSAGSHTVSETSVNGYTATFGVDCDATGQVTLALGDVKTCTLTNNDNPPSLTLVKQVVNDNGGTATAASFTLTATGPTSISGAGGATSGAGFVAGTYTLSETNLAGYTAGAWSCAGGLQTGDDITIGLGESAICTIINNDDAPSLTLVKQVINDNGGTAVAANWTLTATGPTSISGAGGATSGASFDAGTYALSESTGPAGYTASGWSCVGGTQNGSQITLGLGQSATCTIVNDDNAPSLTLVKQVINDNGGTAVAANWMLTATGPTSISGAGGATSGASFDAGTYALSESTGPAGYTASAWSCVGGTQTGSNITVGLGQSATCTIVNDDIAPKLTVTKLVVNDNGGTETVSDFFLFVDSASVDSGEQNTFSVGSHTVTETSVNGYTATFGGDCDATGQVTLGPGDVKTCTLTNNDNPPSLTLVKQVVNDNGGTATAASFTLTATGPTSISGAGGAASGASFDAGTYTLSETNLAGYTAGAWSCVGGLQTGDDITIGLGESATCTITNDDIAPRLTVTKTVVNNNGGTRVVGDFALFVDGSAVTSGVQNTFAIGSHAVSETPVAGYTTTFGGDCNASGQVSLSIGDVKTCTITNDDIAPRLTVTTTVVNNSGGTRVVSDFALFVDGSAVTSGVQNTFAIGSHAVTETPVGGYAATFGGDCNASGQVSLSLGDVKTCTITNDDIAPRLTVTKTVVNNSGGTRLVSDFALFVDGSAVTSGVQNTFAIGSHAVTETPVGGYAATFGGDCNASGQVSLSLGDVKTCTITNDDLAPRLTVTKTVVNNNGGTRVVGDFALFVDGTAVTSGVQNTFAIGSHAVSETPVAGYATTFGGDCNASGQVSLSIGDVKTCTITNDDIAPRLTVTKTVVNNNGGTRVVGDFALFVDGSAVTSGVQNTFAIGSRTVTETPVAGYAATFGGDCNTSGQVTLSLGDVKTCTITNDDIAPRLTVTKTVVNNNGGTRVVGDFALFVDGSAVTSGVQNTFAIGSRTVSETPVAGYAAIFGGDCNASGQVTLSLGDVKTCTITNDDIAPRLTVTKTVVNNNGGTRVVGDFALFVDGSPVTSGVQNTFAIGSRTVSETPVTGYAATFGGDCNTSGQVSLSLGDVKTCTITNDDIAPRLTVTKTVVNNNGGTRVVGDFALFVDGSPVTSGVQNPFSAGLRQVSETNLAGYAATFAGDCNASGQLTLNVGDVKSCTVTNDDIAPRLIVVKHVVNDHGGTATAGDFTMTVTGSNPSPSSFAGAEEPGTIVTLGPGSYSVSETGPSSYGANLSADCTGTIAIGQTKTCIVTNDDISAELAVTKTGPAAVLVNDEIDFLVTVTNNGPNAATEIVLTDTLPTNATFVSATSTTFDCREGPQAGTLTCTRATLASGASAVVSIKVLATALGTVANTVLVDGAEFEENATNNSATAMTTVNPKADLAVTKTGPATALVNDEVTYTVTVHNSGPSAAPGVTIIDTLPGGATLRSVTASQGSCTGTATLMCALGTLASGADATVTVVVTVTPAAQSTITNTAVASSSAVDPNAANNTATVTTAVIAVADVSLTQSDSPDPVFVGASLTYTLTAHNNGPSTATGVTLNDLLPAGVTFVSATATAGTCSESAGTVTCGLGTLASGASATVTLVVTPGAEGTLVNTADVDAVELDPDASNNIAIEETTVVPLPTADLAIAKTGLPNPAAVGADLTYVMTVTNNGPDPAVSVVVSDVLPAGVTLVSATASAGTCTGAATVSCSLGGLAVGASATVTLVVRPTLAAQGTTLTNTASVASDTADPVVANNTATATVAVRALADLALTKTDDPDPVLSAGREITYTLVVTNRGPSAATGVTLTDELPSEVGFVRASASQGSCSSAESLVTCALGALAVNANATVQIVVTTGAAGKVTNSADVFGDQDDSNLANNEASASTDVKDLDVTGDSVVVYCATQPGGGGAGAGFVLLALLLLAWRRGRR